MENKYDGLLLQMVQESRGYEGFFDSIFGFLRRKTDFFSVPQKAEQVIASMGEKHIKLMKEEKEQKAKESEKTKKENPKKEEVPQKTNKKEEQKVTTPVETKKTDLPESKPEESKSEEKSDKLAPNKGNGSQTENYLWTQTLEEVNVVIPLGEKLRAKDLIVELGMNKVYVAKKDKSRIFIDDEWFDKIHVDDSLWTVEDGEDGTKNLNMTLVKWRNTMSWWDCLVKSEPKIDTQKINPEPSKLTDLDGEMKTQVSKMMFDMKQKQAGLPSSDELEKQEKLKAFMKAHPELDFSKAKFS